MALLRAATGRTTEFGSSFILAGLSRTDDLNTQLSYSFDSGQAMLL